MKYPRLCPEVLGLALIILLMIVPRAGICQLTMSRFANFQITGGAGAGLAKQRGFGVSFEGEKEKWTVKPIAPIIEFDVPRVVEWGGDFPARENDLWLGRHMMRVGHNSKSGGAEIDTDPLPEKETNLIKRNSIGHGMGLELAWMGGKSSFEGGNVTTTTLLYLKIPIYVTYTRILENHGQVFAGIGPYIAIGLSGNFKYQGVKTKVKFGTGDNADFKRTDIGLELRTGYKFAHLPILIKLFYDLGLKNILPHGQGGDKIKNRFLGLSVDYLIFSRRFNMKGRMM